LRAAEGGWAVAQALLRREELDRNGLVPDGELHMAPKIKVRVRAISDTHG